jgi:hypothetical protein
MRQSLVTISGLLCALVSVRTAMADDGGLQTTLRGRYAAMKVAMSAHDDNAMRAFLTPDFISIDITGKSEGTDQRGRCPSCTPR